MITDCCSSEYSSFSWLACHRRDYDWYFVCKKKKIAWEGYNKSVLYLSFLNKEMWPYQPLLIQFHHTPNYILKPSYSKLFSHINHQGIPETNTKSNLAQDTYCTKAKEEQLTWCTWSTPPSPLGWQLTSCTQCACLPQPSLHCQSCRLWWNRSRWHITRSSSACCGLVLPEPVKYRHELNIVMRQCLLLHGASYECWCIKLPSFL